MLVLSQYVGEGVVIDLRKWGMGIVEVMPTSIRHDKVRMGYTADQQIPVHRKSVFDAIQREKAEQHPAAEIVADEIEQGNVDLPGGEAPC